MSFSPGITRTHLSHRTECCQTEGKVPQLLQLEGSMKGALQQSAKFERMKNSIPWSMLPPGGLYRYRGSLSRDSVAFSCPPETVGSEGSCGFLEQFSVPENCVLQCNFNASRLQNMSLLIFQQCSSVRPARNRAYQSSVYTWVQGWTGEGKGRTSKTKMPACTAHAQPFSHRSIS